MAQEAGKTVAEDKANQPRPGYMWAKIYTPFTTFFEGEARSITAKNDTGVFDVLAEHHNFITMLLPYDCIVEDVDGKKQTIPMHRGLLHVKDNHLTIFMEV